MTNATRKSAWEIDIMRQAGRIVGEGLKLLEKAVRPGVSTGDLDALFEKHVLSSGARPTFKGYRGFPASLCVSINEEVVHGIPSFDRKLKDGDIVSLDAGATFKNYVGDAAITVGVGKISPRAQKLIDTTRESLEAAIAVVGPGAKLSVIAATIQNYAESRGYAVVKKYVGHGIGQELHEPPQVPNFVQKPIDSFEFILREGHCIAIEPMVNEGTDDVKTLSDHWTVVTLDRRLSAHFEHTIAVTKDGREVLTRV
ncbi:MAG TPA: type I methionyl aminopeptidase [Planctomycetota bacterium]|nr:type I methionyl aminopeptidase [Planctomycetota bacterium]